MARMKWPNQGGSGYSGSAGGTWGEGFPDRPYMSLDVHELERRARGNWESLSMLRDLASELYHRKSRRASELLLEIDHRIRVLEFMVASGTAKPEPDTEQMRHSRQFALVGRVQDAISELQRVASHAFKTIGSVQSSRGHSLFGVNLRTLASELESCIHEAAMAADDLRANSLADTSTLVAAATQALVNGKSALAELTRMGRAVRGDVV